MLVVLLGYLFLVLRIVSLGAERIFLKYFEKWDSLAVGAIFFLMASLMLSPILLAIPVESFLLSSTQIITILAISVVYAIGFFAYVKAIATTDTSLVAPLYNSSLLWLLLLGFLLLGDSVGVLRIMGGILMFVGVFFLYPGGLGEKIAAIQNSKGSKLMIAGSFFFALGRTIDSYLIVVLETNAFFYAFLSNFLIGFYLLLIAILSGKFGIIKDIVARKPKLLTTGGLVTGWSYLFLLFAFNLLEVTIAEPLTLLSVFVTAFLAKYILDEDVKERLPGMVIMVTGAVFLVIS